MWDAGSGQLATEQTAPGTEEMVLGQGMDIPDSRHKGAITKLLATRDFRDTSVIFPVGVWSGTAFLQKAMRT